MKSIGDQRFVYAWTMVYCLTTFSSESDEHFIMYRLLYWAFPIQGAYNSVVVIRFCLSIYTPTIFFCSILLYKSGYWFSLNNCLMFWHHRPILYLLFTVWFKLNGVIRQAVIVHFIWIDSCNICHQSGCHIFILY